MNKIGSNYNILSMAMGIVSGAMFLGMFLIPSLFVQQILIILSPAALAIPALSMGIRAVMIASVVGIIAVLIVFPSAVLMYIIIDVIPIIAMTYLFIRVYENKENPTNLSIGKILSIMSVISCILMIVFMAIFPYEQAAELMGIQAQSLKDFFYKTFASGLVPPKGIDDQTWDNIINAMVSYFPASLFLSWLARGIISMIFAQWIVSSKEKMLRTTPDYSTLDIPKWAIFPLPVLIVGILIGGESLNYILENAFVIMLTPFLCLGLSQVHIFARKLKGFSLPLLIVFYIIFFTGYAYAMLVVSLLGIFEFFINQKLIKDKMLKE